MAASLAVSATRSVLQMATEVTCATGIYDCSYSSGQTAATCAAYDGEYIDAKSNYVLLVLTIVFAAAMAFSIGGNDGATAWATSVHSFAIKLRPACLLAGVFEVLGASTLGYGVSSSIQKGISNLTDSTCFACGRCDSSMSLYYAGMMASLISASSFLLTATYLRMPVSTTHAIVSAVLGMTVAYHGFGCVQWNWDHMGGIIASWVISPLCSGFVCLAVYYTTYNFIFAAKDARQRAFIAFPVIYFVVVFFISFLTITKAPPTKNTSQGVVAGISAAIAAFAAILITIFMLPYLRKNMPSVNPANKLDMETLMADEIKEKYQGVQSPGVELSVSRDELDLGHKMRDSNAQLTDMDTDRASLQIVAEYEALTEEQQDAMWMFKYVLILVACMQSFAHGSNDTANATAALSAVVNGFNHGIETCESPDSPWWIMMCGGVVLAIGILLWGYKVMETMGRNICIVNFHRAFCTEFSSSVTVVIASLLNLPVSSTHCQVGAVIFVSIAAYDWRKVNWSLLTGVFATWICTLPLAALVSGIFAYLFKFGMKA